MRRRVYCEMLPYAEVTAKRTLDLLARYGLELILAVRPWHLGALPDVTGALRDAGVAVAIWPMLGDEEGRWANVDNAASFRELTLRACDAVAPADVLLDLEPPFAQARTLASLASRGRPSEARSALKSAVRPHRSLAHARKILGATVDELAARGATTSLAVWPVVALDHAGEHGWQALLGTPVDGLAATHVSIMMYTSLLEGWSRGAVRRRDAAALLAAATVRACRRWPRAAGVSLGCVGVGAFEDEPTYRDPGELAADVAIARAAGCDELSLFDLGGVLARGGEPWLEAFVHGAEAPVLTSKRVRLGRLLARAATRALPKKT